MMMLIFSIVIFGVAVLWRRRWRRLAPAGIGSLFMGGLFGWLWISLLAGSGVMMFTPAGVTISAPAWLGGETRVKIVYSQIDWLGTRDRIQWKRDRRQERWWMKGAEPGWQRVKIPEYLVKMKGGEETQVDMSSDGGRGLGRDFKGRAVGRRHGKTSGADYPAETDRLEAWVMLSSHLG